MLTKIAVEKTYWIGMTGEQKDKLLHTLTIFNNSTQLKAVMESEEQEVLDDLRQSLLNQ